jgi:hypothetical protein
VRIAGNTNSHARQIAALTGEAERARAQAVRLGTNLEASVVIQATLPALPLCCAMLSNACAPVAPLEIQLLPLRP